MITDARVEIDAPVALVWEVFADVERWADWTESVTEIVGLDGPDLGEGRRFRIKQPRMPKLVWTVVALDPGTSWTWHQSSPGGSTTAVHEVVAIADDRTRVRQSLEQAGPVGALFGQVMRGMTRRYLELEAQGLKAASERRFRGVDAG